MTTKFRKLDSAGVRGARTKGAADVGVSTGPVPEAVKVLHECADLQLKKSRDYQNPDSNVRQADHYRRGVGTIHDMLAQKLLRAQSLIEAVEQGKDATPNFESLEDTYKDIVNYASFAVSYLRGRMDGQKAGRDFLNRSKKDQEL